MAKFILSSFLLLMLLFALDLSSLEGTFLSPNHIGLLQVERRNSEAQFATNVSFSTVKEEICNWRDDTENETSMTRYCVERQLHPDKGGKILAGLFPQNFKWLKLDFVKSEIPGDIVGPGGVQLIFNFHFLDFHNGSNGEMRKKHLIDNVAIWMLLQEFFCTVKVDNEISDSYGSANSELKKVRNALSDAIITTSENSHSLYELLSRPLVDSFIDIDNLKLSKQLNDLSVFSHLFLPFDHSLTEICKFSPLSFLDDTITSQSFEITHLLSLLGKEFDFFNRHLPTGLLIKQSSLLLTYDQLKGVLVSKCHISSKEHDKETEEMLEMGKPGSLLSNSCDKMNQLEFEMIDLECSLKGKGAHRWLMSKLKIKFNDTVSKRSNCFCKVVVLQWLQSDIFADPFELQKLVHNGDYDAAYVHGDTNIELPSPRSHQSIVEIELTVKDPEFVSSRTLLQMTVELPLHARYPALSSKGYIFTDISVPHVFIRCGHKSMNRTRTSQKNMQDKHNYTTLPVVWSTSASMKLDALRWRIPSGNPFHTHLVTFFTLSSAFVSVIAIFVASVHSLLST